MTRPLDPAEVVEPLRWKHVAGERLTRAEIDLLFAAWDGMALLPPGAEAGAHLFTLDQAAQLEADLAAMRERLVIARGGRRSGDLTPDAYDRIARGLLEGLASGAKLLLEAHAGKTAADLIDGVTRTSRLGTRAAVAGQFREAALDVLLDAAEGEVRRWRARAADAELDGAGGGDDGSR